MICPHGTVWQYCLCSFKSGNTNLNDLRMCSYKNLNGLMASSQKMGNFGFRRLIWKYFDQKHVQISNPG